MTMFNIEVTDTFAGDANYCWVKRYQYEAKDMRGAITKMSREHGGGFRLAYSTGDMARYNLRGACVCAFVTYADSN